MINPETGKTITSSTEIEEIKKVSVDTIVRALPHPMFNYDDAVDIIHRAKSKLEEIYGRRFS